MRIDERIWRSRRNTQISTETRTESRMCGLEEPIFRAPTGRSHRIETIADPQTGDCNAYDYRNHLPQA